MIPGGKHKTLTEFDDVIANRLINKEIETIVTQLFICGRN